ncbi:MAG: type VI secretion system contractile sheath large subunit [Burkholderiaceae bacterium]|jgi:type VI secretion system protein ImpC|nr:type VI secretion system contractile sheath large subunit [Burkholderiaceae bacterium]
MTGVTDAFHHESRVPTIHRVLDFVQRPESREAARRAFLSLFRAILREKERNNLSDIVDLLIVELDAVLTRQLNAVMHHEKFQRLESSWRNLQYLVSVIRFDQNIQLAFINVSKDDLLDDFDGAPEITRSGLYRHVYTAEYGQFGGQPIAVVIADYSFGPGARDMQLLRAAVGVSAMAHSIFLAMADPSFFDIENWDAFSHVKSLDSLFGMPQYTRWRSFRGYADSRYAALLVPGFLLRLPYGNAATPVDTFAFEEDTHAFQHYCWGSTAFVLAGRMADSFAKYRWCFNMLEQDDKTAETAMARYHFYATGDRFSRVPVGTLISGQAENRLAALGFIAAIFRESANRVGFLSANSCHERLDTGRNEEELGEALSVQLPYITIITRLAHYIKVIQRDHIGTWKDGRTIQNELNKWLSQYVTETDDPDPLTRSRRPLRMARVVVHEGSTESSWFDVTLLVRPHIRHMGANFTLTLASRLDKRG